MKTTIQLERYKIYGIRFMAFLMPLYLIPYTLFSQNNALILNGAYVIFNGGTSTTPIYLVVNQSSTSGITRPGGGHIVSEGQYNFVQWNSGTGTGNYLVPFGVGAVPADYIPFTFNKTTGGSSNISLSTWATNSLNVVHPGISNVAAVTSMTCTVDSVTSAIDRFWDIRTSAPATGDLTFSYRGSENTTTVPTDTFKAQHWDGSSWDAQVGPGNPGVTSGIGTVGPIPGQTTFSPWVLTRALSVAASAVPATVCSGSSVQLNAAPSGGSGTFTYSWASVPAGFSSSLANPVATPSGNTTYYVTVINCETSVTGSVSITVNSLPSPTASNNGPVCEGTTLSLTGGPGGMTSYSWSGPNAYSSSLQSPTVSATSTTAMAGVYSLTVTDGSGCTNTTTTTVTVNALPAVTAINNGPVCEGNTLLLTGGPGGMTSYSWSGPSAFSSSLQSPTVSASATTAMAGVYSLTVTDASGCNNTTTTTVTVNTLPSPTASNNGPVCEGTAISLTGGPGGMTSYSWAGPNAFTSSSQSPTVSASATTAMAGVYSLTVTDGSGCTNTTTTTVTVNSLPSPTATNNGPVCEGTSLSLTGGPGGMVSYSWSGPNAFSSPSQSPTVSASATIAMAGVYSLTVTDGSGCTNTTTTTATVNALPSATASNNSPVCEGDTLSLTGGPGGMTSYSWSGPSAYSSSLQSPTVSASATTAMAGVYSLTITDASGCNNTTTTTVTVNPVPTITSAIKTDVTVCGGSDGTITITATGFAPLTYSIDGGGTFFANGGNFSGLTAAIYYTAVSNGYSCVAYGDTLVISTGGAPPAPAAGTNATYCEGATAADLTATAGSGGTLDWYSDPGLTILIGTGTPFNPNPYLSTGTNNFYVTETVSGCQSSPATVTITINALPIPSITGTLSYCAGSNTTLDAGGGYSVYSWSTGSAGQTTVATIADNPVSVTVTDANGCTGTANATVTENPAYSTSATASVCAGDSILLGGNWQTTAGTYYDTLSSQGGCDSVIATTLTVNPTANATATAAICTGDSIFLQGSWQTTSGTYYDTLTTIDGCDSIITTTLAVDSFIFNPLSASICPDDSIFAGGSWQTTGGVYYDTLTAVAGCDSIVQTTLTVNPTATATATAAICIGDSIFLQSAWQTSPGIYYDTLQTGYGCDSIVETTLSVNSPVTATATAAICSGDSILLGGNWQTSAGTYYDTLTAANGCDSIIATTLTVNPTANATATATICAGDSILLGGNWQISAGTYYDTLTSANGCDSIITTTLTVNPAATATATATICAGDSILIGGNWQTSTGTYYDTLTAANGCDSIITTTLTVNPAATATATAAICAGDSILLGGNWQTSAGTYYDTLTAANGCDSIIATTLTVNPTFVVGDVASICSGDSLLLGGSWQTIAGIYTDTLTSQAGCDSVVITNLTVNSTATATATATICFGDSVYLGGLWQTTPGTYYDTLLTVFGCDSIIATTLTVNSAITVSFITTDVSCFGGSDGGAAVTAAGGSPPYSYLWSTSAITSSINLLPSSIYSVTVTDSLGCNIVDSISITEPLQMSVTITKTDVTCNGNSDGTATAAAAGGSGSYSYIWSNGNSTSSINLLPSSIYSVTVTDANNCSTVDSIAITQPVPVTLSISASDTTICKGESITLTATVAPAGYTLTYTWSTGMAGNPIIALPTQTTGFYVNVFVTECNLTISDTINISVNNLPLVNIPVDTIEITLNEAAQLSVTGGVSYSWTPAATLDNLTSSNPVASPTETTEYEATGTDSNGCTGVDSVLVVVITDESVFIPNIFSPNGDKKNDEVGVMGQNIKSIEFNIYDRWGEKVFEYSGSPLLLGGAGGGQMWDGTFRGKKLTPQVFVYYGKVEFYSGREEKLSGTITLVE